MMHQDQFININDKAIAIDPEPEKLDIDDVFLPINKQAEEWGEILLKQLPDSMRESVDVKDLTRCLDEKASEMDIRGDLILPDSQNLLLLERVLHVSLYAGRKNLKQINCRHP